MFSLPSHCLPSPSPARLIESDAAAAAAGGGARWVAPSKFRRVTRKFWVHPAAVARLKAEVAKHLPVLIYGGERRALAEEGALRAAGGGRACCMCGLEGACCVCCA